MAPRAVITGFGCVSGLGGSVAAAWENVSAGVTAIRQAEISAVGNARFQTHCPAARVAGESLEPLQRHFTRRQLAGLDPLSTYAAAATLEALTDAGLLASPEISRAAIVYGSASGGNTSIEAGYQKLFDQEADLHPMTIPRYMNSAPVAQISALFGVHGMALALSSACSSSAHAVGEALHFIRAGRGDIVVTGGSDASLTYGSVKGWMALQAMASDTCRPFSLGRKGMVLGEGATTIVLEELTHAVARKARIYAEVVGYGTTSDGGHITRPDAGSAARAIALACADARLGVDEPCLISAHGTGTALNDRTETEALKLVYGESLPRHRVIATKSNHGHMLGAAGATELMLAVLAVNESIAPPICNFLDADPECDLPLVLARERLDAQAVVSSSFAFGGSNSVLVTRRI